MTKDTGPARLPALPPVNAQDPALRNWMRAVAERLEVREGSRGNPYERAVTVREMVGLGLAGVGGRGDMVAASAMGGASAQQQAGYYGDMSADAFAEAIRNSKLYQGLIKRLDDATRFDDLPEQVRAILLVDIADEARKRQADIRTLQYKLQTATNSLAYQLTEVTAAVEGSAAGVREMTFASATRDAATAGKVTQVQARIDGVPIPPERILPTVYASLGALTAAVPKPAQARYYQVADAGGGENLLYRWNGAAWVLSGKGTTASATATLEETAIATADRIKGLSAEKTIKVQAGNKVAGIGLSATEDPEGNGDSAFIVMADRFAIVGTGEEFPDPKNPPLNRIPFGIDTATDTVYINGQLRISGPTGPTLEESLGEGTVAIKFVTRQFFRYSSTGSPFDTELSLEAVFDGYLSQATPAPVVTWEVISGYGGALPGAGTSNTFTLQEASMTAEAAVIRASYTDAGATVSDTVTVARVRNGMDAITGLLTNEAHTVPTNSAGVVSSWAGAGGKFTMFRGDITFTTGVTFTVHENTSGVTVTIDAAGNYAATAAGTWAAGSKVASITLRAAFDSTVVDKVFTITKSIAGAAGSAGASAYNWFAYANNSNGTVDFTTGASGGRTYIGIAYNKSTPTESTNPADYEWSLLQGPAGATGATGSAGTNGLDGAAHLVAETSLASSTSVTQGVLDARFSSDMARSPRVGDAITMHNQTAKWSQTWVRGASSWGMATLYIDGNAVITGTLYADTISASKVVIRPIGAYIGSSIPITAGLLTVTLTTTTAVATPLWSYALFVADGVMATVSWVNNTSTTCTFSVKAITIGTGAAYTGTIGNLKIWMF